MWGSRDPLSELWDSLICLEWLKLVTSYSAQRWMAESNYEKNTKLGQNGSCGDHVTHFWNFGTH